MFIPLHDQNKLQSIQLQYVTLGLIVANVIVWILTATPQIMDAVQANAVYYSYGFIPAVVGDRVELPPELVAIPETASYLTYAFLHGDFMHLAGNMLFLWVFGDNVEDAMGHLRFFVFYLVCAVAGAFGHAWFAPNSEIPLIGASGAAAGIIGAYLVLHPKVKVWILLLGRLPLRLSAMWVLTGWIAFQIFNLFALDNGEISWAAHVGGFIAGAALIVVFKKRDVPLFDANLPDKPPEIVGETNDSRTSPRTWGRGD